MAAMAAIFLAVGAIIFVARGNGSEVSVGVDSADSSIQSLIVTPNPNNIQLFPTEIPSQPVVAPVYETHTVGAGDTLADIAAQYAVTWQEIAELNGLANPNALEIGQILKIPVAENE